MKFRSIGYCIGQGFRNIARNRIFSLASIATMALCIFIFGMVFSITSNMNYMVKQLSGSLCVKVFFDYDISSDRITSIGETIKTFNDRDDIKANIYKIDFTSAQEAWETYKEQYFGEEYMDLAEGYADDNPLANSASYEIYFQNADAQDSLVEAITGIDGVRKVNSSDVTADSLTEVDSLVKIVSLGVLAVLLLIALFLISNTISIGITVRSEEISIMRLLGARNGFIRAPFIVEGVIIGLIGATLPLVAEYFMYGNVVNFICHKFSFIANVLAFMPVNELYLTFLPVALLLGVGLGFLGSVLSVSKHLKA